MVEVGAGVRVSFRRGKTGMAVALGAAISRKEGVGVGRRSGSRCFRVGWLMAGVAVGRFRKMRLEPGLGGALESLRSSWLPASSTRGELSAGGSSEGAAPAQPTRRIEASRAVRM